jgi:hypothetical protein
LILLSAGITASFAQTDTTLQQYTGRYKFAEGGPVAEVTVVLDNGALSMNSSVGTSALQKQADDVFTIVQFQGTATFRRNEAGKIIGVSISAMGYSLEGKKEDAYPAALSPKIYSQRRLR